MSINNDVVWIPQNGEWIAPTLQNGWVETIAPLGGTNTASVSYSKDALGVVRLRGRVRSGATGVNSSILTLPEGFRPAYSFRVTMAANATGAGFAVALGSVMADGRVGCDTSISGTGSWLQLEAIQFLAEN